MSLTSKRMLQFVMLCGGACALSASATDTPVIADSFEYVGPGFGTTNGVVGMKVAQYKCQPYGSLNEFTNFVWTSGTGDRSELVAADAANQNYAASQRPMEGAPTNLVLKLETEGQTLTRSADAPHNFLAGDPIYIDTLVKFTPSEDNPVIDDSNVKVAVFVNTNLHLVVFHGTDGLGSIMTDTGTAISTSQWYRLTILLGSNPAWMFPGFKVYLDGLALTTAQGYDDFGNQPGPWFINPSADNTVNAVGVQGTGMIDELVIADHIGNDGPILLTLDWDFQDNGLFSVTAGELPVAKGGVVEAGTEIVIDANDWYEIASVTGAGDAAYTGLPAPGALVNASTGTVHATAAQTLTIDVQPYSASTGISTGLGGGLPADKVAAWALGNGLSSSALTEAMLDDYLCSLAPGTNPQLKIVDMVVNNDTGMATITVGSTGNAVDFDTINGTLVVKTAATLEDLLSEPARSEYDVTLQLNATAMIDVDMAGNNFIKACIQ